MARKKSKRRDDDEDDLDDSGSAEVAALDDDEDDDIVRRRKPKDDAWTGLLALALVGLVGASVLFYLDHAALSAQQVSPPNFTLPGLAAVATPG